MMTKKGVCMLCVILLTVSHYRYTSMCDSKPPAETINRMTFRKGHDYKRAQKS